MRITRLLSSTRLILLLFLVPPAAMWARSEGSGGWLLPIALALFALVHFAIFDTKTLSNGHRQRLGFTRNPGAGDKAITVMWGTYCLALFAIVTLVLLFAAPRVGLFWLVVGAIALPLTGGVGAYAGPSMRRRRMLWSEITNPFALLILPAAWVAIRTVASETGEPVTQGLVVGAWTITLLCALSLCAYLMTCLIRDASEDASAGQITTPTLLGRHSATVLLLLTLVAMQMIGAFSTTTGAGAFSWITPAACALGGMATLYAVATDSDDAAPNIMLLTQAALILSFIAS